MDLGLPGAHARPTSDASRIAYDLTTEHFGPGYNGTLTVLAEHVTSRPQAATVAAAIARMPGVVSSEVAVVLGDIALVNVVPSSGPNDPRTADLVHLIRDHRAAIEADSGTTVLVGGQTAMNIDTSQKLSQALPVFLLVIVGLAFVLLTFAFRTILVPIKSILGFLLSAGAALGAEVAVFQWGWGKDLLGVEPTQTLSFLPVILLAVMAIAGREIWYHPRWFGRHVPDPDIEGDRLEAALAHEQPIPAGDRGRRRFTFRRPD